VNRTSVDAYLRDGCGRCDKYQTPACKVLRWTPALAQLRQLALAVGLTEEMKWGSPCYTVDGKNVAMLVSLMDCCALSFFQGAALADDAGLLERPGPNSRIGRMLKFRSEAEVDGQRPQVQQLLQQAVDLARRGVKVMLAPAAEPIPPELEARLARDATLQAAFAALTPGRRRSHVLHIGAAKQVDTRLRRLARCVPVILAGRGWQEK
jgi:uncharacterized protein YdeI (YjbR/CyaY-like superfamily)